MLMLEPLKNLHFGLCCRNVWYVAKKQYLAHIVAPSSDDLSAVFSDLNSHAYGNFDPNIFSKPSIFEALPQQLTVT